MKATKFTVTALLLSGSLLFSSCVGSFGLFNRLSTWNQQLGSKFVNELVFIAFNIVPAYGIAYAADALVINAIEFWTGSNPMANAGDVRTIKGENANYMVENLENGYSITKEGESESLNLVYDEATSTWSAVAENGEQHNLVKLNENGTADLYLPDGTTASVTLDEAGMMDARSAVCSNTYFASR